MGAGHVNSVTPPRHDGTMTLARLLERLEATDIDALDPGGVSARLRDVARLKGRIAGLEAQLARRANQLSDAGAGLPADELLGRSQPMSRRSRPHVPARRHAGDNLSTPRRHRPSERWPDDARRT